MTIVAVEGVDDSGRSMFILTLSSHLRDRLLRVWVGRDPMPYPTQLSEWLDTAEPPTADLVHAASLLSIVRRGQYLLSTGQTDVVIFDRYTPTLIAHSQYDPKFCSVTVASAIRLLLHVIVDQSPAPDVLYYIDTPIRTLRSRARAREEEFNAVDVQTRIRRLKSAADRVHAKEIVYVSPRQTSEIVACFTPVEVRNG